MSPQKVKERIKSYPQMSVKAVSLERKLINYTGEDPLQAEMLLGRLDQLEQDMERIKEVIYDDSVLTERESNALELLSLGYNLKTIGKFLGVTGERARQLVRQGCRKLSDKYG
jgi:DNA-binding CsgD family transcriptional regulator